jgi:hypothetical protein
VAAGAPFPYPAPVNFGCALDQHTNYHSHLSSAVRRERPGIPSLAKNPAVEPRGAVNDYTGGMRRLDGDVGPSIEG